VTAVSGREAWRRLYTLAGKVRALAPWQWMSENDIFGVRASSRDEPMFVSVMGETGQHLAIAAYLGVPALHAFVALQAADDDDAERLLEIPQLQASFEDRRTLDAQDLERIRALGLRLRGRRAWPMFRGYRPGRVPWFLQAREVTVLATILEQVLEVAPRARADRTALWPPGHRHVLVRVRDSAGRWEERVEEVSPAAASRFAIDAAIADRLRSLPPSAAVVEADLFLVPGSIQDRAGAPVLIYSAMLVEATSGFILGAELLEPRPDVESMLARVPTTFATMLLTMGTMPAAIHVRSERMLAMLQPFGGAGVALRRPRALPALDAARRSLVAHFAR
jgi:hypothetical protein